MPPVANATLAFLVILFSFLHLFLSSALSERTTIVISARLDNRSQGVDVCADGGSPVRTGGQPRDLWRSSDDALAGNRPRDIIDRRVRRAGNLAGGRISSPSSLLLADCSLIYSNPWILRLDRISQPLNVHPMEVLDKHCGVYVEFFHGGTTGDQNTLLSPITYTTGSSFL